MKTNHVTELTQGGIPFHLVSFSLLLMLGTLFQLSCNMLDTVVIGRSAGKGSLAAVGSCDRIMNLLIPEVSGICVGVSVPMGNFLGAKDRDRLLLKKKAI